MPGKFEGLSELRKGDDVADSNGGTRTVIHGYYALSDKDRAKVDKQIRKFAKAIKNNDQPVIDFKNENFQ